MLAKHPYVRLAIRSFLAGTAFGVALAPVVPTLYVLL